MTYIKLHPGLRSNPRRCGLCGVPMDNLAGRTAVIEVDETVYWAWVCPRCDPEKDDA